MRGSVADALNLNAGVALAACSVAKDVAEGVAMAQVCWLHGVTCVLFFPAYVLPTGAQHTGGAAEWQGWRGAGYMAGNQQGGVRKDTSGRCVTCSREFFFFFKEKICNILLTIFSKTILSNA